MTVKSKIITAAAATGLLATTAMAEDKLVSDEVIAAQRAALAEATAGAGFGPQSPRDLATVGGANSNAFRTAPASSQMHLCNIHFHENAEHKGGIWLQATPLKFITCTQPLKLHRGQLWDLA